MASSSGVKPKVDDCGYTYGSTIIGCVHNRRIYLLASGKTTLVMGEEVYVTDQNAEKIVELKKNKVVAAMCGHTELTGNVLAHIREEMRKGKHTTIEECATRFNQLIESWRKYDQVGTTLIASFEGGNKGTLWTSSEASVEKVDTFCVKGGDGVDAVEKYIRDNYSRSMDNSSCLQMLKEAMIHACRTDEHSGGIIAVCVFKVGEVVMERVHVEALELDFHDRRFP